MLLWSTLFAAHAACTWDIDGDHTLHVPIAAGDWTVTETYDGATTWTWTAPAPADPFTDVAVGDDLVLRIELLDELVVVGSEPDRFTLRLGTPPDPDAEVVGSSGRVHMQTRVHVDSEPGPVTWDGPDEGVVSEEWVGLFDGYWGSNVGDWMRCIEIKYAMLDPVYGLPVPSEVRVPELTFEVQWDGDWRGREALRFRPWADAYAAFMEGDGGGRVFAASAHPHAMLGLGVVAGTTEGPGPCPAALDGACLDLVDPVPFTRTGGDYLRLDHADLPLGEVRVLQGVAWTDHGVIPLPPLPVVGR